MKEFIKLIKAAKADANGMCRVVTDRGVYIFPDRHKASITSMAAKPPKRVIGDFEINRARYALTQLPDVERAQIADIKKRIESCRRWFDYAALQKELTEICKANGQPVIGLGLLEKIPLA